MKKSAHFGQELILNLYGCNLTTISSKAAIKRFAVTLCDRVIKMKRYGPPLIPHFGHADPVTSGYSLVQLIETSSITAHFSEFKKSVYLNIFSCAPFDPTKTIAFCKKYFGGGKVKATFLDRP